MSIPYKLYNVLYNIYSGSSNRGSNMYNFIGRNPEDIIVYSTDIDYSSDNIIPLFIHDNIVGKVPTADKETLVYTFFLSSRGCIKKKTASSVLFEFFNHYDYSIHGVEIPSGTKYYGGKGLIMVEDNRRLYPLFIPEVEIGPYNSEIGGYSVKRGILRLNTRLFTLKDSVSKYIINELIPYFCSRRSPIRCSHNSKDIEVRVSNMDNAIERIREPLIYNKEDIYNSFTT